MHRVYKWVLLLFALAAALLPLHRTDFSPKEKITVLTAALTDGSTDGYITEENDPFEDILSEFEQILPNGVGIDQAELTDKIGIAEALSAIAELLTMGGGRIAAFVALIFALCLIFALLENLAPSGDGLIGMAKRASGAVISLPVFLALSGAVGSAAESLSSLGGFFSAAVPIFTAVLSLGGKLATAGVVGAGMNITLAIVSGVLSRLLLPLCAFLFASSLAFSAGGEGVGRISGGVRSFFFFIVGAVSFTVISCFALQSVLAAREDGAMMRTVKYAVSGMLPIVGGAVSSTLSTLGAGLAYASGIVGVGAVVAVVSIIGAPLIELILYRLTLSLAVSFLDFCGAPSGRGVLSSFLFSLDALIAVFVMSGVVYLTQILIFIKGAVAFL